MKRLTSIEKSTVAIGVLAIVVGIYIVARPYESLVYHPGPYSKKALLGPNQPEHVSRQMSRFYGWTAVVTGTGLCVLAFYRGKKGKS
jgi:hypothetical protein